MIKKFKIQNSKFKCQIPRLKFCHLVFMLYAYFGFCALTFVISPLYAKEITILYTGETHAMLYPCSCPLESDGGVGRRATLIKQIRKSNPDTLLLDSGGFFSGGLMDEYTQNTELDKQRAIVNLKAMELMKYDAVAIGDDEFNFGREFLEENVLKTNLAFLSSNISDKEFFKPYLIKEIAGTKFGIIGVTSLLAKQKAGSIKFIEPKNAVSQAVQELKKNKADIIVLLSHLGENEDLNLIKDVSGIDILIIGHSRTKEELSTKMDSTLILRPSWQGRKLGKLSLTLENNKITNYTTEELRLSDGISDDPDVLSILPRCFSDNNCKRQGMVGVCQDAGTLKSQCQFIDPSKVSLLIITPKLCNLCDTERIVKYLKTVFPGLVTSYLYYPDANAEKLIDDFGIKALPIYLLGKEVEKEKVFDNLKANLEIKGDFYMLKSQFTGISYFLNREKVGGKLDLFISLYDKDTPELLVMLKEFNPSVHFLAVEKSQDNFESAKGNLEVEEYLRSVCVQKYYGAYFWDYISCRAGNINTSWWEDCLTKSNINKLKICARSQEGKSLLRENISLNKELQIMFGPSYLIDNQEIFATKGIPPKEVLEKIIKK